MFVPQIFQSTVLRCVCIKVFSVKNSKCLQFSAIKKCYFDNTLVMDIVLAEVSSIYIWYFKKCGKYTYNILQFVAGARGNICKNYKANQNGTVLGAFKCPLPSEPSTHIFCCGKKEMEYCCKTSGR